MGGRSAGDTKRAVRGQQPFYSKHGGGIYAQRGIDHSPHKKVMRSRRTTHGVLPAAHLVHFISLILFHKVPRNELVSRV